MKEFFSTILLFCTSLIQAETVLVGHRGGDSQQMPENTLEIIIDSFQREIWGHEIDVRKTADNKIMLMHDSSIDRTTDGMGNFSIFTSDQLLALDAGLWKDALFAGYKIPFLKNVLTVIKENGSRVYIDIKDRTITSQEIATVFTQSSFNAANATFLTFSHSQIVDYSNQFPTAEIFRSMWGLAYNGSETDEWLKTLTALGAKGVTIRESDYSKEYVDAIHSAGLKVALVGSRIGSSLKLEEYIVNGVDEIWIDDLRSNLNQYKTEKGILKIPESRLFKITSTQIIGTDVILTWNSLPGVIYEVETSKNLKDWHVVIPDILGSSNGENRIIHSSGYLNNERCFYRVRHF